MSRYPPGTYSVGVVAPVPGPGSGRAQGSTSGTVDRTPFFYSPGTTLEAAFVFRRNLRRWGAPFNEANPLKLIIGDNSCSFQGDRHWASYTIAAEGRYYLPVADLSRYATATDRATP